MTVIGATIKKKDLQLGPAPRVMRPVVWWAALGGGFLALQLYVFARYVVNIPANVPAGPTDQPWWMEGNIRAQQLLFCVAGAGLVGRFVLVPALRRRPIGFDGLLILACVTILWQNWGVNWFRWWAGFNSILVNRGSWYHYVPFWTSPTAGRFAEAPVIDLGFYIVLGGSLVWLGFVARQARKRWPQMGNVGLCGILFVFCTLLDFSVENLWIRGGLYHYGGAPHWGLLFKGHYYQFPFIEAPMFGLCLALMTMVRFRKDDKGLTVIERGIESVSISRRSKQWLRFLALVGVMNLSILIFNLSWAVISLRYGQEWPADVLKRSYFVHGICGANTDRTCAGPSAPLPLPGSAYMNKDGGLSYPPGWVPAPRVPLAE